MPVTAPKVDLSRLEADRLVIALDRHAAADEVSVARQVASAARTGELSLTEEITALVHRCLASEGTAPSLLQRVASICR
jgi:hypothetical protein